ncbi:MAG: cytochrome b/b6 domain-containing protein [Rhizobium sp.]
MPAHSPQPAKLTAVWDLPVRLYHWLQVLLVAIAALTGFFLGGRWIDVHIWAGAAIAALVAARIVWGFAGSTYARFSSFIVSPRTVLSHVRELRSGTAHPHLGHNPLGAVMIIALLLAVAGLTLTGTATLGGVFKRGPAAFVLSYAQGTSAREMHEILAYAFMALIGLHIAGALFESARTGENLTKAMVTGKKVLEPLAHQAKGVRARPLAALASLAFLFGAAIPAGFALSARTPSGMPTPTYDPSYIQECTACHMAYNPSLLPADSWRALMADLDDHFGEDASLDPDTEDAITAWLTANSAETADTKPANVFRHVDAASPYELTETRFWKRMHGDIPDSVFKTSPINTKGNCKACHSDAEGGSFYPGNINIPKEASK